MNNRDSDGAFRKLGSAMKLKPGSIRALWVQRSTVHLKRLGLRFSEIAEQLTRAGRGERVPTVEIPEGLEFPPDYRISAQACHKAYTKALTREPALEAEAMRREDTERCEEMFLSLQPGLRKGSPRHTEVAVRVLDHKARINGYASPTQIEVGGKSGAPLSIAVIRDMLLKDE
jgi:hypothetical protein